MSSNACVLTFFPMLALHPCQLLLAAAQDHDASSAMAMSPALTSAQLYLQSSQQAQ